MLVVYMDEWLHVPIGLILIFMWEKKGKKILFALMWACVIWLTVLRGFSIGIWGKLMETRSEWISKLTLWSKERN